MSLHANRRNALLDVHLGMLVVTAAGALLTLLKIIISRGEDGKWCIGHWFDTNIPPKTDDCKKFLLMYVLICHLFDLV